MHGIFEGSICHIVIQDLSIRILEKLTSGTVKLRFLVKLKFFYHFDS